MANSAQARKRIRQASKRRERNMGARSNLRTAVKKVVNAIKAGDKTAAQTAYQAAVSVIDRGARTGIIHKNKAARHKSRLNAAIVNLA